MKIDGLMSLLSQALQNKTSSDAAAGRSPDLQAAAEPLNPAAIYHPATDEGTATLPTYEGSNIEVYRYDAEAAEKADREMWELWSEGLGTPTGEMRYGYEAAIAQLSPELAAKDWGFSVRNDAVVIIEGDDDLTDQEIATLKQALSELELPARTLAANVVRYLELDRGTDGVSKRLGRFDVSQQNFDQVIDMRELLLSHGEDAKYGRDYKEPSNYRGLYRVSAGHAIVDQILERAEVRFLATSPQRDYQTRVG